MSNSIEHKQIIETTKNWIEAIVIGLNLCPFAKAPFEKKSIRYLIKDSKIEAEHLACLLDEFQRLDRDSSIETTVIILPQFFEAFHTYLDLLEAAQGVLEENEYESIYQIASFHPDYQFEETKSEDPENYTNRSPYPILHLLRESTMEDALKKYSRPESIPERNIKTMTDLGSEKIQAMLKKITT